MSNDGPDEIGANDEALELTAHRLREEHRDLDAAIQAMERNGPQDMLAIRRLKKKKLQLKDEILRIEDRLNPDIIA